MPGEKDKIVPKEQAELIMDRIIEQGGLVECQVYPGEGHGWRRKETLRHALKSEMKFYNRVLNIDVPLAPDRILSSISSAQSFSFFTV